MTVPMVTTPQSARTFLFGDESIAALQKMFTESDALQEAHDRLAGLGESVWAGANKELATMASDFLNVDLASVAVAGWKNHKELQVAAQRTRGTSGSAVVPLGTRDIALTQRPQIELRMGDRTVTAVKFELKVNIKVVGVVGVVRNGALVALEGGHCEITVSFSAGGVRLGHKTADFDPHYCIPLGAGIPLSLPRQRESSRGEISLNP
jgi:hypothetical protein